MIPLIPVIAVMAAFSVGLILYAADSAMELQDLRNTAAVNTQERLQERLSGRYEGDPLSSIEQATILSEWTDDSHVTGIMVKCGDGATHVMNVSITVRGGQLEDLNDHPNLLKNMTDLAKRC